MASPAKLVQRIHFDDFDGRQFERLVFAYHIRSERWLSLEWYGQTGSDLGRDMWGIRQTDASPGEKVCIQCANRKTVPSSKATRDIDKVLKSRNGKPDVFRFVCAASVSARARDAIKHHAETKGIFTCDLWSGEEFEERLRSCCQSLLNRFVEGESFPDEPKELRKFVEQTTALNDSEILGLIARAFDRPAFHTSFHSESSLPAFKQAITDTIQVLNTGIWQTRDGKEIGRIPSRHMVADLGLRSTLTSIERQLVQLRARFDKLIKSGKIKHCSCDQPDCPVHFFSPEAAHEMDDLRSQILSQFHKVCPQFSVAIGWVD